MLKQIVLFSAMVLCLAASHGYAAESNSEKTRRLVGVLQSEAPFYDKARACQQLGEFGDKQAVPALAALLGDDHLAAYARSGLEGIPDPSSAAALRSAASRLKGNLLIGVIHSLGVLRDADSVGLLQKMVEDPAMSGEALLALGSIASDEAVKTIQKSLTSEAESRRASAAAACLLAAERQGAAGHADVAVSLYNAVRQANVPMIYRAGATRGAIVSLKSGDVALLIESLRSPERMIRNAALTAICEIPGDRLATALNEELGQAPVELQVQLITAFLDCHNARSLEAVRAKVMSNDAEVRKAALLVMGRIGGPADAAVLLKTVMGNASEDESAIALNGLGRMEGIDAQIIKAMESPSEPAACVKLIRLAEGRGMTNTVPALLKLAASGESKTSLAALKALKSLAGPADLKALINLVKTSKNEAVRDGASQATVAVCLRTGKGTPGAEAVLAELKQTANPELKNSWITILVSLSYANALPAIQEATRDANDSVAGNAIEQLARWSDAAPIEELFSLVQSGGDRGNRALTSAIQLATAALDDHQQPNEVVIKWFQRASQSARNVPAKRMIISALGRMKTMESFNLLAPGLEDASLNNETAIAIVQIAPALHPADPAPVHDALQKIASSIGPEDLRNRAAKLAATFKRPGKRVSLFDGRTLSGWEGNTNVWRVQDGAIAGGSMKGNPRNEFLATTRSYTNFILRLEYKLVGTNGFVNGGVQFRSVRVKKPENEMSGYQADIGAGYSGTLYDESRRNKVLLHAPDEQIKRIEKPGDWNRYEVHCSGAHIQIFLNGEKTVDYTEPTATIPQEGFIALQIHGNCNAEIYFRNIVVEE